MSEPMILYTNPTSRGRIARWGLEEAGVSYEAKLVNYGPEMKSPEYLAINPAGKVPALTHGDKTIIECAAICAYAAELAPADSGLVPPPTERAEYYRWMFFAAGPIETSTLLRYMKADLTPDQIGIAGCGSYDAMDAILNDHLANRPYVLGDRFSMADVYFGSQIGFGLQFQLLESTPTLQGYWQRISDRPACRRATEADDAMAAEHNVTIPS